MTAARPRADEGDGEFNAVFLMQRTINGGRAPIPPKGGMEPQEHVLAKPALLPVLSTDSTRIPFIVRMHQKCRLNNTSKV